jgi:hypothetical protein
MKLMTKRTMLRQLTITTEATSKIITEAINKIQGAEVDTHLLEEVTGDLKTPPTPTATEERHQIPKAEVHTEVIVATKIKETEEDKTTTKTMVTQTKIIENIAKHQATL